MSKRIPGRQDETVWKKATEFRVTKLPSAAGPKPGQSLDAYLYGKTKGHEEAVAKYRKQQERRG